MNIYTVRDNLIQTIEGKEYMLQELEGMRFNEIGKKIANGATIKFLAVNIDELRRILQDVEVCCEQHTEMGWQINSERMGQ